MIRINLLKPKITWRGFVLTYASGLEIIYDYCEVFGVIGGLKRGH